MKSDATFPLVVAISVSFAGCAMAVQYSGDLRIYDQVPHRPVVAVGRFVDARKDKTVGTSGGIRLEPKTDVGIALQEQITKALYNSKFNVVFVEGPQATTRDPYSVLEENQADVVIQGTIRNFQIRSVGSAWVPADIKSRLTVTTLLRGEKESRDHDVLITGSRRFGMGFGYANDLYFRALELIAVGVTDDPSVKRELEKARGGKRT